MTGVDSDTIEIDLSGLEFSPDERGLLLEKVRESIQEIIKERAKQEPIQVVSSRPGWIGISRE